jgi:hypothetical protein
VSTGLIIGGAALNSAQLSPCRLQSLEESAGDTAADERLAAREDVRRQEAELRPGVDRQVALAQDHHSTEALGREVVHASLHDLGSALPGTVFQDTAQAVSIIQESAIDTPHVDEEVGAE